MAPQIPQKKSYSLTNTKYLLTCFIVILHCRIKANEIANCPEIYEKIDVGIGMFCDCAVPGFFFISAYLFYANFDMEKYFVKIQSRFKSLIIPFVIFSFLGLCHHCITHYIKGQLDLTSLRDVLSAILTQKYNGPIWYLVTLFHFCICAPALWYFINRYKWRGTIFLGILFLFINLIVKISYTSIFFWMPVLVIGAYLGCRSYEKSPINIPWYYGLLFIPLYVVTYFYWGGDYYCTIYYLWRILGGILVVLLCQSLIWKPFAFEKYMMFVFLTQIMMKSLAIIPNAMEYSLLKVMEVIVIGTFIAIVLKRISPTMYNIMTGSR